jgi:uncharacterized protein
MIADTKVTNRIIGFDLARAYAIFGMFIVNYNTVFGFHQDKSFLGKFLQLFNGNSSTTFVILAGMGVSLLGNRSASSLAEEKKLRAIIVRRSWFLFAAGLLLYLWWPADILHFYGGYLHLAALLLFVPPKYYLVAAGACVVIFHLLLGIIPYETGWNLEKLVYTDFWTISGFLRNTFYNGWNPIFPWAAFFFVGMWLGRLPWHDLKVRKRVLLTGIIGYGFMQLLLVAVSQSALSEEEKFYFNADYLPPFLPFMLSTVSFSLVTISVCIFLGDFFSGNPVAKALAGTGQMTLTHYVVHLTLGMVAFALLFGKDFEPAYGHSHPVAPLVILLFACTFFAASVLFSTWWKRRYKHGPLEMLMRKISG